MIDEKTRVFVPRRLFGLSRRDHWFRLDNGAEYWDRYPPSGIGARSHTRITYFDKLI